MTSIQKICMWRYRSTYWNLRMLCYPLLLLPITRIKRVILSAHGNCLSEVTILWLHYNMYCTTYIGPRFPLIRFTSDILPHLCISRSAPCKYIMRIIIDCPFCMMFEHVPWVNIFHVIATWKKTFFSVEEKIKPLVDWW